MARTIQIPITVEFAPTSRRWEICEVQLADLPVAETKRWGPPIPPPLITQRKGILLRRIAASSMLSCVRPSLYTDMQLSRERRLTDVLQARGCSIYGQTTLEVLVSFPRDLKPKRLADPWQMRQNFFELRHSTKELGRFLDKWGSWDAQTLQEYPYRSGSLDSNAGWIEYVIPEDVWNSQASCNAALAGDAAKWLAEEGRMPTPTRRSAPPFLATRDVLCKDAIQTTITMDKLANTPYRLCARTDCGTVFKLESNHSREYCTQSCAHLVSVRRGREAKRQAKASSDEGRK